MFNQEIVKSRKISRLCHFTRSSNLPYILGNGEEECNGIVSNQKIKESKFLSINDKNRYDGRPDLICTSLQYPNFYFFEASRNQYKNELISDWVIILISPDVIDENTYFCPVNAAKGKGQYISKGSTTFDSVFAIEIEASKASPRKKAMKDNIPTDNQAEVLFEKSIPREAILGLVFSSLEKAKLEKLRLRLCNISMENIDIYYSEKWYNKGSVYELQEGKDIVLEVLEE